MAQTTTPLLAQSLLALNCWIYGSSVWSAASLLCQKQITTTLPFWAESLAIFPVSVVREKSGAGLPTKDVVSALARVEDPSVTIVAKKLLPVSFLGA